MTSSLLYAYVTVLIFDLNRAEKYEYSFQVHTHEGWTGSSGGSNDIIYWRLCHDAAGTECGIFQRSKWVHSGHTYSATYTVPWDLATVNRVDIVNEGDDGLRLDWIKVNEKQHEIKGGFWIDYVDKSYKGCAVLSIDLTKSGVFLTPPTIVPIDWMKPMSQHRYQRNLVSLQRFHHWHRQRAHRGLQQKLLLTFCRTSSSTN